MNLTCPMSCLSCAVVLGLVLPAQAQDSAVEQRPVDTVNFQEMLQEEHDAGGKANLAALLENVIKNVIDNANLVSRALPADIIDAVNELQAGDFTVVPQVDSEGDGRKFVVTVSLAIDRTEAQEGEKAATAEALEAAFGEKNALLQIIDQTRDSGLEFDFNAEQDEVGDAPADSLECQVEISFKSEGPEPCSPAKRTVQTTQAVITMQPVMTHAVKATPVTTVRPCRALLRRLMSR